MAKGKDPHAHCFPTMEDTKWEHMIGVWNSEKFKKHSEINKENRKKVAYNHTMGSKSFASTLHKITSDAKGKEVQPKFSDFFKLSHESKKTKVWIDPLCKEDFLALQRLEYEPLMDGDERLSPEELSKKVFGKKKLLESSWT